MLPTLPPGRGEERGIPTLLHLTLIGRGLVPALADLTND